MDVKYVPTACYTGSVPQKFYQHTVIDEASRERFIYPYMEQSSYSTMDFLKCTILYFEYQPDILQTDNGTEFTHWNIGFSVSLHNILPIPAPPFITATLSSEHSK